MMVANSENLGHWLLYQGQFYALAMHAIPYCPLILVQLVIILFYIIIGLIEEFPSLAGDLRDQPTVVLQSLGLAVSQVLCDLS